MVSQAAQIQVKTLFSVAKKLQAQLLSAYIYAK